MRENESAPSLESERANSRNNGNYIIAFDRETDHTHDWVLLPVVIGIVALVQLIGVIKALGWF